MQTTYIVSESPSGPAQLHIETNVGGQTIEVVLVLPVESRQALEAACPKALEPFLATVANRLSDEPDNQLADDQLSWAEEMDGDHASALASAGWGTDEDYRP